MIDIIIVTYNNEKTIINCLRSIDKYAKNVNVKIFDNASTDNTYTLIQKFKPKNIKKLSIFRNLTNIGFAKACNFFGLNTYSEYLLFMNPDMELIDNEKNIFDLIPEKMKGEIKALGVTHEDFDGDIRTMGVVGTVNKHYDRALFKDENIDNKCLYISGGFFVIKTVDFKFLCGFDESLFMYYEDFDLCLRLNNFYKGGCIINIDDYTIKHKFQGSNIVYNDRMNIIQKSREIFMSKWKDCEIKVGA